MAGHPDLRHVSELELLAVMAAEIGSLRGEGHTLPLALDPLVAMQLCGCLQLALRHPQLPESHRQSVALVLDTIAGWFASCPATTEAIRRGGDPAHDVIASDETLQ